MTCSSHKFEVVDELRIAFFYLLFDELINNRIGLPAARTSDNDGRTLGIDDIDPTVVPFFLVIETGGQIDGILVLDQAGLLHKAFVLVVEYIVEQVVLQQAADPDTRRQQAEVADGKGEDIERSADYKRHGQFQQPPVEKKSTVPTDRTAQICTHLIFSSLTPLVPIHERARNTTQKSLV